MIKKFYLQKKKLRIDLIIIKNEAAMYLLKLVSFLCKKKNRRKKPRLKAVIYLIFYFYV